MTESYTFGLIAIVAIICLVSLYHFSWSRVRYKIRDVDLDEIPEAEGVKTDSVVLGWEELKF
jgi:hypothetical protein